MRLPDALATVGAVGREIPYFATLRQDQPFAVILIISFLGPANGLLAAAFAAVPPRVELDFGKEQLYQLGLVPNRARPLEECGLASFDSTISPYCVGSSARLLRIRSASRPTTDQGQAWIIWLACLECSYLTLSDRPESMYRSIASTGGHSFSLSSFSKTAPVYGLRPIYLGNGRGMMAAEIVVSGSLSLPTHRMR